MAMGTLSNEQVDNAAGIYNLMRNAGGSVGIAAMIAFLSRGVQTHLSPLVSHLTPYDAAFRDVSQKMQSGLAVQMDSASATQQTYAKIYGIALRQASLLSYIDNFRLLAFLCVLCIPTAFLFKRVKAKKGAVAVH